uniref:U-box domain-containing protein n=1 Tax=Oryza punctata TaxID=4537 RepID=A0A0E0K518_ORYPU
MVTPMIRPRARARAARLAVSEIPLAVRRSARQQPPAADVPDHFLCPISLDMMRDPVTAPTGITYDRDGVEVWLERGRATCPVTGRPLRPEELVPNHATRRMIQEWCVANRAFGVERVPTPRVPVSVADAREIFEGVAEAARRGDAAACGRMVARARALGKESERNRRCLASAGAARALAFAFSRLAAASNQQAETRALEEILAALVVFFPLDEECRRCIASSPSLDALVSILSHGEQVTRVSAVVVLREIASSCDNQCLEAMSTSNAMYDALANLVAKPVSPQATKAALVTAYYLVKNDVEHAASRFVDLGMVELLVELLADADKGTTEKALAVLDTVLVTAKARDRAYAHALAVPVLAKKTMHVSDMATEFAVSALLRLCKNSPADGGCKAEALQVGAFQKLLLLLQLGCDGVTKERASELLKLLNPSRDNAECIETADFKGLKRPFI